MAVVPWKSYLSSNEHWPSHFLQGSRKHGHVYLVTLYLVLPWSPGASTEGEGKAKRGPGTNARQAQRSALSSSRVLIVRTPGGQLTMIQGCKKFPSLSRLLVENLKIISRLQGRKQRGKKRNGKIYSLSLNIKAVGKKIKGAVKIWGRKLRLKN